MTTNWQDFHGPNVGYVLELYERYLDDPTAVDQATRAFFKDWQPPTEGAMAEERLGTAVDRQQIVAVVNLAQSIREYGHLAAQLDPLGSPPPDDPTLHLAYHGLDEAQLRQLPADIISGPAAEGKANAWQAIAALQEVYTGHIGFDFNHIRNPEERSWLREAAECGRYRPPEDPIDPVGLLERLTRVEKFEQFLHRIFPGKTRFSIEGLDMLVPILDELVGDAAEQDTHQVILGMAHRGRLNVLAHVFEKPYNHILAEFKDPGGNFTTRDELGWTGDVKYHKGSNRAIQNGEMVDMLISMAPNPSHLEHVNPVVVGMARAIGTQTDKAGPPHYTHHRVMPILIHGDAAFSAQGIVAETLNLSRLPGYQVGGTIHIIANNQLGFTTDAEDGRSTLYASDLAKGFKIPIIHVNADDVEACIEVTRLAHAYRDTFQKDVLIDLIGYRRYGHNEGDEPRFTQPAMYARIEKQPTVREQWAATLLERGLLDEGQADTLVEQMMGELQEAWEELEIHEELLEPDLELPPPGAAKKVTTAVPLNHLHSLNQSLLNLPDHFKINRKLKRALKRRRTVFDELDERQIDWATAEELAMATILADGTPIRLTGEDVERGTFSHRHAVFHGNEGQETFIPLQRFPQAAAAFEIHNSPLSENAAVGFEYGYDIEAHEQLVIWEAQYGDFVNGAQAVIDEFIVSGRAKWEQTPALVMLLPHGYEGQGPDHSTGRPERFLQLAAETNLRLANPTTAAQYFHLLRRQAALLKSDPLPLIVMTPKSLLRHERAASTPRELAEGRWQPIIDDLQASKRADKIRRLLLCSGKVYVDLVNSELRQEAERVAIARVEQLYRFPYDPLADLLSGYPNVEEVIWVQEEPKNMGYWAFVQPRIEDVIDGRWPLSYIGRPRRASPAEGSATWHKVNQEAIVERALHGKEEQAEDDNEN